MGRRVPSSLMWRLAVEINDNIDVGTLDLAVATLVLAAGTIALVIYTSKLADTSAGATDEARKATGAAERSAIASEKAAEANERAAAVAQIQVESIDMPFIIATDFPGEARERGRSGPRVPVHFAAGGQQSTLSFRLVNIGAGPGIVHEVRVSCHGAEIAHGLPDAGAFLFQG